MLNVIKVNVVMLNVMAPAKGSEVSLILTSGGCTLHSLLL
jgi:hypothetical protein